MTRIAVLFLRCTLLLPITRRPLSVSAGYRDGLLVKAVDLAGRLMPAFDTPSGIPLSWVNLHRVRAAGPLLPAPSLALRRL